MIRNSTRTVILLLLLIVSTAWGLRPGFSHHDRLPEFNLYHFIELNGEIGLPSLAVEIRIANDDLQFERLPEDGYQARAEVTAELFQGKERISVAHAWCAVSRQVNSFNETHADEWELAADLLLTAAAGEYTLWVRVHDLVTNRVQIQTEIIALPDLPVNGLYIGRPRLRKQVTCADGTENEWQPTVRPQQGVVGEQLGLVLECWSHKSQQLQMELSLTSGEELILQRDTTASVIAANGFEWLIVLPGDLKSGDYRAECRLTAADGSEKSSSSHVFLRREGSLATVEISDNAIEQLRYLASRKTMKRLRDALPHRREQLFNSFWKELDPTPMTPENELQYEYYRRIELVNKKYAYGITPGWRTDRGRTYIVHGPPDSIEQHPFETQTPPYEVWDYYEKELRFVFMDRHGFGDYRLVNSIW